MRTLRDVCSALVSLIKHLTTRSANLNCTSLLPAVMLAGGHRSRSSSAHSVRVLQAQPAHSSCARNALACSFMQRMRAPVREVQNLQHEDIQRLQQLLATVRDRRDALIQQLAQQCSHQAAQWAFCNGACGLRQRERLRREVRWMRQARAAGEPARLTEHMHFAQASSAVPDRAHTCMSVLSTYLQLLKPPWGRTHTCSKNCAARTKLSPLSWRNQAMESTFKHSPDPPCG